MNNVQPMLKDTLSNDADKLYKFCEVFSKSSIAPPSLRDKPNDCYLCARKAIALGVAPELALSNMFVVNGQVSIFGDLAVALGKNSPNYERHNVKFEGDIQNKDYKCTVTIYIKGNEEPFEYSYSYKDAIIDGSITKSIWKANPKDMIFRKATRKAFQMCFPESYVGCGVSTANNIKEAELEIKDITPQTKPEVIREDMLQAMCGKKEARVVVQTTEAQEVPATQSEDFTQETLI